MTFTPTGVRIWDPNEPVSVHGASSAQALSITTKVVGQFPDVTARNAAYNGYSNAQKAGAICWVVNRAAHSMHDGTAWQWMPVRRTLCDVRRPSPAVTQGTGGISIIDAMVPTALPPGNRRIEIIGSTNAINHSPDQTDAYARAYPNGTNMPDGERWAQGFLPASSAGYPITLSNVWHVVASGTVEWDFWGLNARGGAILEFMSSRFQVYDLGATDD